MNTCRTLLKLANTKKLNYKVSKNEHITDEDKNKQIHYQIKRFSFDSDNRLADTHKAILSLGSDFLSSKFTSNIFVAFFTSL